METYDNVHRLVKVNDLALVVYNGNSTDTDLGEHVHNVEHCRLHGGRRKVSEGLLGRGVLDVGTDTQLANAKGKVLRDVATLHVSHQSALQLTFIAMNFRTRY